MKDALAALLGACNMPQAGLKPFRMHTCISRCSAEAFALQARALLATASKPPDSACLAQRTPHQQAHQPASRRQSRAAETARAGHAVGPKAVQELLALEAPWHCRTKALNEESSKHDVYEWLCFWRVPFSLYSHPQDLAKRPRFGQETPLNNWSGPLIDFRPKIQKTRRAREPKSKPASLPMACGSCCFPAQGSEGKPRFKLFTVGKSTPKQMKKGSNRDSSRIGSQQPVL